MNAFNKTIVTIHHCYYIQFTTQGCNLMEEFESNPMGPLVYIKAVDIFCPASGERCIMIHTALYRCPSMSFKGWVLQSTEHFLDGTASSGLDLVDAIVNKSVLVVGPAVSLVIDLKHPVEN